MSKQSKRGCIIRQRIDGVWKRVFVEHPCPERLVIALDERNQPAGHACIYRHPANQEDAVALAADYLATRLAH